MSSNPPVTGTFSLTINGTTYTGTVAASVAAAVQPAPPPAPSPTPSPTILRPVGNTGVGPFVKAGQLFDSNGAAFRVRGVNRNHYDSPGSAAGIAKAGANATRIFVTNQYGATTAHLASICQSDHIANKQIVVPVCAGVQDSTGAWKGTSGSTDNSVVANAAAFFAGNAGVWKPLEQASILNIANEWGPKNSAAWASAYAQAITQIRAAGLTHCLMVDAGGYGQDDADILNYAPQVFAGDPQGNTIFGVHLYGTCNNLSDAVKSVNGNVVTLASTSATHPFCAGYNPATPSTSWNGITAYQIGGVSYPSSQNVGGSGPGAWTINLNAGQDFSKIAAGQNVLDYNGNYVLRIQRLAALQAQGICVVISEFGPGQNVGPSPTLVTPSQIINACEAAGLGWMPWAWDDNNEAGGLTSPTGWFGMTLTGPGNYNTAADLTAYGQAMIPFWASMAKYHT